jgi:hypothetical protein
VNNILIWLIASILSAILYRLGGTSAGTKWRDLGCPLVVTAYLLTLGLKASLWGLFGLVGAYFLAFGLLFGALTTYWKKKGTDAHWWNWAFTGLGYSLSALPLAFITGHWIGFGIRSIVLTILITFWSEKIGWDVLEETGRGFLITATLPLLLI